MGDVVPLVVSEDLLHRLQEADAVGDGEADQEVDHCRHGPVGEDLDEGVDLVFSAHRPHFKEGEPRVHGENHDRS